MKLTVKWRSLTQRRYALIAIAVFAIIAAAILALSRAATGDVSLEAESATKSGKASAVTDASASGGQALHFGAATNGGGGGTSTSGDYTLPLKISANKRYLTDQSGKPFFMTFDTAWTLPSQVPDFNEAVSYIDARKAQGFNTIAICMTCWNRTEASRGGVKPFVNDSIAQPNDEYFAFVDRLIEAANERNMILLVGPLWLGSNGTDDPGGVPPASDWAAYGTYLGNRYSKYHNIIWFLGGDHQLYDSWSEQTHYDEYVFAIADALNAADTGNLITYHPSYDSTELSDKGWLDFYMYQQKQQEGDEWTYDRTQKYYDLSAVRPVINAEPPYEDHMSAYVERRNAWWSYLSGALGVAYGGAVSAWNIGSGGANQWQNDVQSLKGAPQVGLVGQIATKYSWQKLVPDYGAQTMTGGQGGGGADRGTAGMSPDGDIFMAYVPNGRTITVNMSKFAGSATATWYDPTNGQSKDAGSGIANSGPHDFQTPGNNAAGESDWVLVIKV